MTRASLAQRGKPPLPPLETLGSADLLKLPLVGLLCSRECPGHVILETLDRVPGWVAENRVILSGFHSPLEQQVLRSLLRREGRAVKLLARTLKGNRLTTEERAAIAAGRMAVASAFAATVTRVTRQTADARNQHITRLAAELVIPYARPGSTLEKLRDGVQP